MYFIFTRIYSLGIRFVMPAVFLFLTACAQKELEVKRFFWPPLSDDPKIEYVGFVQTDYDITKLRMGRFEETVFGREIPRLLFKQPFDVYSDGISRLYVTEAGEGYVQIADLESGQLDRLKDKEGLGFVFKQPLGLDGDRAGNIYVCDSRAGRIYVFGPDGRISQEWTGSHFRRPLNIAVDSVHNRVYVVEPDQHAVLVLDSENGRFVSRIGERGTDIGRFNFPLDLDVDVDGNLYVLDSLNFRVQKFSPEGEFLLSFGEVGTALGSFQLPKGIAVSPSGFVYVTDSMAHRLVVFDSAGRFMITIGGKFPAVEGVIMPGGLYLPQGIGADSKDRIWVVDTLNRMVHKFQYLSPAYLEENPILPGQAVNPFEVK